jgi:hypothetical protein
MAKKRDLPTSGIQQAGNGTGMAPDHPPAAPHILPLRAARRPEMLRQRREERRQAAARKHREWWLIRIGLAVVAALILAALGYMAYLATQMSMPLEGVAEFAVTTGHSAEIVAYEPTPPVGGEHDGTPQTCGFYAVPVRSENAVHSLEHGAVWITYQPGLPSDQVDRLRALARDEPKVLVSPYEGLPAPVVASSWGRQLQFDSAADERLGQFVRRYRGMAPEPNAPCAGVGTPL